MMGEQKRRAAVRLVTSPTTPRVAVRLSERQQNRVRSAFAEAAQAHHRAMQTLTDILIGRDVDLERFERWEPSPDGKAALLTPKAAATDEAPSAPESE